jgi:hypothetical protein
VNRMKKPKVTFTVEMHEETTFLPADGSNWSLHLIRLEDGGMASGAYIGQHCEATASMIAKDLAETVGGELVRLNAVELHARRVERLRGAIARYRDQYIPCHESRLLTPRVLPRAIRLPFLDPKIRTPLADEN